MKGTFVSFDFVKNNDGDLKFLEMNTDTTANQRGLDSMDFSTFLTFVSSSDIQQLDVIYKPEIHTGIVNELSASAVAAGHITTFNRHSIDSDVVYPESPTDSDDKFILRLAYDENAIVDSTYCKNSEEPLKLLHSYNSQSLAVPFYYSGSSVIDTLETTSLANTLPDVALKGKSDGAAELRFAKVADWNTIKSDNAEDYYITNYIIQDSAVTNKAAESIRHYSIVHGATLTSIDVGTSVQYGKSQLPTDSIWSGSNSENLLVNQQHHLEFSTGIVKISNRREGIYSTDYFVSASGEDLWGGNIEVGSKLKTFHIPGTEDSITSAMYDGWTHSGKTLPSGSEIRTASAVMDSYYRLPDDRVVYEIKPTDATNPFYIGEHTSVITYNTGSDQFGYTPVSDIDPDQDFLFDSSGSLVDIEEANMIILNTNTGSFFTTDTEPTDNLIVSTQGESAVPIAFTFHNK